MGLFHRKNRVDPSKYFEDPEYTSKDISNLSSIRRISVKDLDGKAHRYKLPIAINIHVNNYFGKNSMSAGDSLFAQLGAYYGWKEETVDHPIYDETGKFIIAVPAFGKVYSLPKPSKIYNPDFVGCIIKCLVEYYHWESVEEEDKE